MEEVGKVLSVNGKKAKVLINRSAACGDCGACQIGKEKMTMETTALNNIKAEPGQEVLVEMKVIDVLTATSIAYGIPLVAFFLGILIGWFLAPILGVEQGLLAFSLGLLLVVISYTIIYFLDRKKIFNLRYQPIITKISNSQNVNNVIK